MGLLLKQSIPSGKMHLEQTSADSWTGKPHWVIILLVHLINKKSILLCLLLLPSTASIAALNEEETRGCKDEWKAQVRSWSITNLISERYFSILFSSTFYMGNSFKLRFYCKGRLKGLPWEAVWLCLGQVPVGGLAWGPGAEQSSLCTVPKPCLSHVLFCPTPCLSHTIRRGFLLSPMYLYLPVSYKF